jgi:hypothetical protein
MQWGHYEEMYHGIRPEEPVALIRVEALPGTSDLECDTLAVSPSDRYLGIYRIISLVSTCFIDMGSLANWFDSENAQTRLQEEHHKGMDAASGTGESSHQPPSVGGTMATGASIPPSIQTARDHERDEDDRRSDRSNSTVPSDVE